MTSHPSQDVATPLALDQPQFVLPDSTEKEAGPDAAAEDHGSSPREEDEQVPQYTAHQLPMCRLEGLQQLDEEQAEGVDTTDAEPAPEAMQSISVPGQEPQSEQSQNDPVLKEDPQHAQNPTETPTITEPPTEGVDANDGAQDEQAFLDESLHPPVSSSPVFSALQRAKQIQLSRGGQLVDPRTSDSSQRGRGRGRGSIPLQRSSSLPSSFLPPSRVVSSVRIQFGRGQASCTKPRYSFRYTQNGEAEQGEEKEEEEDEEKERQTSCLSPQIINRPSSSGSNNQVKQPTETPVRPKPLPRYLLRSSYSLQSSSPPPDWPAGGPAHAWSTQSVPDLSCMQQPPQGHFQQSIDAYRNQQTWNPGQMMFPYPNLNPNSSVPYLNPSPSPGHIHPMALNQPVQYPSPVQPYASLPNLLHYSNPSLIHHSSLTSLHQPITPSIPQHSSLSNLHQASPPTAPHHSSLGNLHPGTPLMHLHSNHLYSSQSIYHSTPYGSQCGSPYHGFQGHNITPNFAFPHPATHFPPAPEHSLHHGLTPPGPGFLPGIASNLSPSPGLHASHAPPALSTTELQLRKVLHDIRGTVQSLSQVSFLHFECYDRIFAGTVLLY